MRPVTPKDSSEQIGGAPYDAWSAVREFAAEAGAALRSAARESGATARATDSLLRTSHLVIRASMEGDRGPRVDLVLRDASDPSLERSVDEVIPEHAVHILRDAHHTKTITTLGQAVAAACEIAPMLAPLVADARLTIEIDDDEFLDLIRRGGKLAGEGFALRIPAELTPEGQRRLRMRLHVGARARAPRHKDAESSPNLGVGASATHGFHWRVAVGNAVLTDAEFRAIADAKRPLVRVRGRWMQVDPEEISQIETLLAQRGAMTTAHAIGIALGAPTGYGDLPVEVAAAGRIAVLLESIRSSHPGDEATQPPGFSGTLRRYQRRGLAWMQHLESAGFGGVLADDMGLGKTIQLIALHLSTTPTGPTLIVCPTSVVTNWEREFARFAPTTHVVRHHGADRARDSEALALRLHPGTVMLTSYGLLRRDAAVLCSATWQRVVLDEAQNIKNPRAAVARAARKVPAHTRLALTGTPVENRLSDLWSIMEFANPGLLGPLDAFRTTIAIPAERGDPDAADRLRGLARPFVLRRLKDEVAPDLPPKVEATVVVALTPEQATLYQAAVDVAMDEIASSTGIKRRGKILALITALKQICDHPALYLHEPGPLPDRSGKLARLTEMLDEVVAEGQAALVFSQYAQMGKLLQSHLEAQLGQRPPLLHGGVTVARRMKMMDAFQTPAGPPVMVVSLKAGGTGVNLTRASHVFHFDRWWNPAVEDQATDRAHRIGQHNTVFVHRFSTAGTLEERIDAVIASKRELADRVITSGEAWATELDDTALREMLSLSRADVEAL